jgi:hypothetical protein
VPTGAIPVAPEEVKDDAQVVVLRPLIPRGDGSNMGYKITLILGIDKMKMITLAIALALAASGAGVSAQEQRIYDLGPVVDVSHVKVEPGQLNAYMSNLNNVWRRGMEDRKRRGEVLDYRVYQNMAPGVDEADLFLVVTYKNAAVMDTSLDEIDRRTVAMQGSIGAANQATIARGQLRTILGNDLLRELRFR